MNKLEIVKALTNRLDTQRRLAMQAAEEARGTATHSESVARSKYETFGLEASYLAHGQSQRVMQYSQAMVQLSTMPIIEFTDTTPIAPSALVTLEGEQGEIKQLFIANCGGDINLTIEGMSISVISPQSPLALQLFGQTLYGDVVLPNGERFEIIALQ